MRFRVAFAAALFAVLAPASAFAGDSSYTEKKTNDGRAVTFIDADQLGGLARGAAGSQIIGIHPPIRVLLMRPRVQFVPEMLKSVEGI
jgi:hypothetical protein